MQIAKNLLYLSDTIEVLAKALHIPLEVPRPWALGNLQNACVDGKSNKKQLNRTEFANGYVGRLRDADRERPFSISRTRSRYLR